MNVKQSYKQAYRIARTNRTSPHFQGTFWGFGLGSIYIGSATLVLSREGVLNTTRPGFRAASLIGGYSKRYRYEMLTDSQSVGRVPLP